MPSLRTMLDSAETHIGRVEEGAAVLAAVAIAVTVNFQVVARYIFDAPFIWPEEVTRLLLVWLSFLGAAAVSRRAGDIAVDTFVAMFPRAGRIAFAIGRDVVLLLLFGFMVVQGFTLVRALRGMELVATEWSSTLLAWPLVIGSLLMALHPAFRLLRTLTVGAKP